jgi:rhamnosyltransferase
LSPRIYAIVVTYLPEPTALRALLAALGKQVTSILIVDNTPQADARVESIISNCPSENTRLIRLNRNLGIATALNTGIQAAIAAGADLILFSDQDSLPDSNMVHELVLSIEALERTGHRVGAIGPTYTDRLTQVTFPFQAAIPRKLFYGHAVPTAQNPTVQVLTLITSGSLVPTAVLSDVGLMREELFIDYVDTEWCYRARSAGYELFGTLNARMSHQLGDQSLRVWYFGWRHESAYSALRMYYRTRNYITLCRMRHVSATWKIRSAWYWMGLVYTQVLYGHARRATLRMVMLGICDGLRGRMGAYRSANASSSAK